MYTVLSHVSRRGSEEGKGDTQLPMTVINVTDEEGEVQISCPPSRLKDWFDDSKGKI
jgi:hypothetical protein